MAAIAEALPVIQRTPEWLEARGHGVGASEAAAALGLSRWESRYSLWARKCGLVPPPEPSVAMRVGTALEPMIASLYADQVGMPVRRVNRLLRSKAHPFLLASLDRRRADGRLVEVKWTERGQGYGEPGTDEVPDEVLVQVSQQMAVTGADSADVAVVIGGRFAVYGPIARDPTFEELLVEGVREFWGHVERRIQPAVDGSPATLRALSAAFPRDDGTAVSAGEEAAEALDQLLEVRDSIADLEGWESELRAQLEAAMGPASELVVPGIGRVTWKAPKDRTETDWRAVAAALAGYVDEEAYARHLAAHTTTKPSTRRFTPRREEETHG